MNRRYCAFLLFWVSQICSAKTFHNSYLQFEMPDNWTCVLAHTEWICNPTGKAESREAVLILAAKVSGPEDNFEEFKKNLSTPRNIQSRSGLPIQSKVVQVKTTQVQGQKWLEALHYQSEIETFYTRYLVTAKERLSILLSLSCQKAVFTKYSAVFNQLLPSLKITAPPELLKQPLPLLSPVPNDLTLVAPAAPPEEPTTSLHGQIRFWIILGLVVGLVALFGFSLTGNRQRKSRRPRR